MDVDGLENVNESLSTHYLIYKITNKINGRYYIGQHQTENYLDDYAGSGILITRAEAKYGMSCFSKTILFDFDNFEDMNSKEVELVQLSNCFPYDPMSYNVATGGVGFRLTPEICKARGQKHSEAYWNKPEEERLAYRLRCKDQAIRREQNKTTQQREQAKQVQRETWASKPKEEIQAGVDKWRQSMQSHTKEQKDEITRKRLTSLNSRSDEEKLATKLKFEHTIKTRSKERKEEIGRNHSNKLKDHYKKHPEQARQHSKRMSGKGNPSYGKRYMNNGRKRVYAKPEDFQKYLDLGYVFGWIRI